MFNKRRDISINPVFRFSNEQGNGPPMLSFESTRDPFLEIDGAVSLFELRNSVKAKVTGAGLEFRVAQRIGTANFAANCSATSKPAVAFDGTVEFPIARSIGPIRLSAGGPNLRPPDIADFAD